MKIAKRDVEFVFTLTFRVITHSSGTPISIILEYRWGGLDADVHLRLCVHEPVILNKSLILDTSVIPAGLHVLQDPIPLEREVFWSWNPSFGIYYRMVSFWEKLNSYILVPGFGERGLPNFHALFYGHDWV